MPSQTDPASPCRMLNKTYGHQNMRRQHTRIAARDPYVDDNPDEELGGGLDTDVDASECCDECVL